MNETAQTINALEPGQDSQPALEGELETRRERRRTDLRTRDGTIRAHGKLLRALAAGKVSLAHFEIESRGLKRHADMLAEKERDEREAEEKRQELQAINDLRDRLAALQQQRTPALSAPAARPTERELPEWAKEPVK